jgi:hypothetical protein
MAQKEPTCGFCKAPADFRITNLYAGNIKDKNDNEYKREIDYALVCNHCGAVICQINKQGFNDKLI